jgi:hypothetical protein
MKSSASFDLIADAPALFGQIEPTPYAADRGSKTSGQKYSRSLVHTLPLCASPDATRRPAIKPINQTSCHTTSIDRRWLKVIGVSAVAS